MHNSFTETHEFLVSILGSVPYGVVVMDLDGYIIMINERAVSNLNISQKVKEIIETPFLSYLDNNPDLNKVIGQCLSKGRKRFDLLALKNEEKYLTCRGRSILNGMTITIEDVTNAKEQERITLNAMLEGQESERTRLAREIHDGIGPVMSTIKLQFDAIKSEMDTVNEKTLKKINSVDELIHEVADDIRTISHALMPSALIDFGLAAALDNLCRKANESELIEVKFFNSGMEDSLDHQIALGIFRITQELLNNAFKYAKASTINVQIIKHPDSILLMVEDDGVGFDREELKSLVDKGIGLRNIQTRTKALGGRLSIDTQPGKGVVATIEIPVNS